MGESIESNLHRNGIKFSAASRKTSAVSRLKSSRPTMCAMLSTGFSISHYNLSLAPTARLAKEQDSNNELYDSSLAAASETLAAYVTARPMSVSIAISNVKM